MSITINCPTCGAELELHDFAAGDVVDCPGCGQSFIPDLPEVNEEPREEVAPVAPMGILKRKPLRIPKSTIPKEAVTSKSDPEVTRLLKRLVKYARIWTTVFIYIPLISILVTVPLVILLKEPKLVMVGYVVAGVFTIIAVIFSFFEDE